MLKRRKIDKYLSRLRAKKALFLVQTLIGMTQTIISKHQVAILQLWCSQQSQSFQKAHSPGTFLKTQHSKK